MENSKNRDMFDRIARSYDLLNHLLSLNTDKRWRKRLVRDVVKEQPARVLDVATGTADVAIALKTKLPEADIIGIDLSEGMLEMGRKKVEKRDLNIPLRVDNGECLSFENDSFDALTIAFGIRNFSDRETGLREFARVLRKGGTVHILEFSTPKRGLFAWIYRFYFHHFLPRMGGWVSHSRHAYDYLPASVDTFPNPPKFIELMQNAGFTDCTAKRFTFGIAYKYTGKK